MLHLEVTLNSIHLKLCLGHFLSLEKEGNALNNTLNIFRTLSLKQFPFDLKFCFELTLVQMQLFPHHDHCLPT